MSIRSRVLVQNQPLRAPKVSVFFHLARLISDRKQLRRVDSEMPDISRALALLLANGLPLVVAISWLGSRTSGVIAEEFRRLDQDLLLGADLETELNELERRIPSPQLAELCQKLRVIITRGSPIANQLFAHSESATAVLHRNLMKKAGANETLMLIPVIFLILPVTVLFALFPSLVMLANQI